MTDNIPLHEFLELEYLGGNDGSGVGEVRMPVKPNAFGFTQNLHGGAIATLIDTVVVPAIGTAYEDPRLFSTIEMSVRYLGPVRSEDLVAEGWVTRRGRRVVFCDVEVRTASAVKVATGSLIYIVGSAPSADGSSTADA